ncbi:MAG: ribonuclease P protein component [Clostridiales bacterium]|nr:ribonuclease P protein component [Clostridiales bacterium]
MNKAEKLKKSYEFKAVYNKGKVYSNNLLVLYIVKNNAGYNKAGFSVSKKVGKSVVRNKVRRRIRECYRLNSNRLKSGYNMVFISRVQARGALYREIENAMISLFKKALVWNCEE